MNLPFEICALIDQYFGIKNIQFDNSFHPLHHFTGLDTLSFTTTIPYTLETLGKRTETFVYLDIYLYCGVTQLIHGFKIRSLYPKRLDLKSEKGSKIQAKEFLEKLPNSIEYLENLNQKDNL